VQQNWAFFSKKMCEKTNDDVIIDKNRTVSGKMPTVPAYQKEPCKKRKKKRDCATVEVKICFRACFANKKIKAPTCKVSLSSPLDKTTFVN